MAKKAAAKSKRRGVRRDLPPAGTMLKGKYQGFIYKARIVKSKESVDGKAVKFDGTLYNSLTAAAKAITQKNVNGWLFWKF